MEKNEKIEYCETVFTYNIPDDWMLDTFDKNKTGTFTYKGPRWLTFEIDKETGRETGWCLIYPEEIERPIALNVKRVTVDCSKSENGLLCEIANDQGHEESIKLRLERDYETYYKAPQGYIDVDKPVQTEPRDYYDEFNITYDFQTDTFCIPIRTWSTVTSTEITWEEIRDYRNKILQDTDTQISDDMPLELKNKWKEYRQLLRDLPEKLGHLPPFIAAMMFPRDPNSF